MVREYYQSVFMTAVLKLHQNNANQRYLMGLIWFDVGDILWIQSCTEHPRGLSRKAMRPMAERRAPGQRLQRH